jgi:hypothetical protein
MTGEPCIAITNWLCFKPHKDRVCTHKKCLIRHDDHPVSSKRVAISTGQKVD